MITNNQICCKNAELLPLFYLFKWCGEGGGVPGPRQKPPGAKGALEAQEEGEECPGLIPLSPAVSLLIPTERGPPPAAAALPPGHISSPCSSSRHRHEALGPRTESSSYQQAMGQLQREGMETQQISTPIPVGLHPGTEPYRSSWLGDEAGCPGLVGTCRVLFECLQGQQLRWQGNPGRRSVPGREAPRQEH